MYFTWGLIAWYWTTVCLFVSTRFSATNIPTTSDLSLPPIQSSLYLLLLAPKNLQPLPLHLVSWILATSTSLSANTTSSPAFPVNESTFQVPTRNPQRFRSLSALRSSWTQPSASAQGCAEAEAVFWLGFCTSCWCRHVGAPTGCTQ